MTSTIKDFQLATAKRILHIFKDLGHRRVLLADEVGLGKTYVARQVIDLVRDWHKHDLHDDFFRVVYICSNANIANQNIIKLGVKNPMSISESRLSMQHLYIWRSRQEQAAASAHGEMPETIIPLTPSTSFRFFSQQGTANERALLYEVLRHWPSLQVHEAGLSEFLRCGVKNWQPYVDLYRQRVEENGDSYLADLFQRLDKKLDTDLIERLETYVEHEPDSAQRADIINRLRRTFAEISIELLDPDLVIMDEFQRFNSLLTDADDEQSMLTRSFFDDSRENTKILLLSATPYKPYTTLEELNANQCDEQYQDFMKLMDFLYVSPEQNELFHQTWKDYSAALKRTEAADLAPLLKAKGAAEDMLYATMCRTERFNSGIIDDSRVCEIPIVPEDILAFAQCQKLMDRLSHEGGNDNLGHVPIEYVKSSPYLLSFMDKYELKKRIVKALVRAGGIKQSATDALLLSKYAINNYRPVAPANGKLKYLHDLVFGSRGEKKSHPSNFRPSNSHQPKSHLLLWVPASNPYYVAGGLFESPEARDFSKIILFSSWEMVPRMVSTMMSYYAELYTFGELKKKFAPELRYTYPPKKARYGENRLRDDCPLVYPSRALAALYSPQDYYGQRLSVIREDLKQKVAKMLRENPRLRDVKRTTRSGAPQILALMKLLDGDALCLFGGEDATIPTSRELYIPTDAEDVLANIAIASPAVCAYRVCHDVDEAETAAKAIVSIFNKSEAAAIIDLLYGKRGDDSYYVSVLDYCVKGNLQAVLDEYAHMLQSRLLGQALSEAILDTRALRVDTKESIGGGDAAPTSIGSEEKKLWMRYHFAAPLVDKTVTDKSVGHTTNLRQAFNSPFRPFILSTTSIGQEGLDFHWYARRIVHWNLPSNPVDLEQREGRINRFECFALRRSVVQLYGRTRYMSWDEIFDAARQALKGQHSDIVPHWCLPPDLRCIGGEDAAAPTCSELQRIERIVPLYPFSRDRLAYDRLTRILALYRLTMGQPRQEELLELLGGMGLTAEQVDALTFDLCPFSHCEH